MSIQETSEVEKTFVRDDGPGPGVEVEDASDQWRGSGLLGAEIGNSNAYDVGGGLRPPLLLIAMLGAEIGYPAANDQSGGLRPPLLLIAIEKRARIIAVKAFIADLWTEWRRLCPDDPETKFVITRPGFPKGAPDRVTSYIDKATAELHAHATLFLAQQTIRIAQGHRGMKRDYLDQLLVIEESVARDLQKLLKAHPLYPWLSQFPGMCGGHAASLIGRLRDPHRFVKPGNKGARSVWHYCGLHVDQHGRLPRFQKGVQANWNGKVRQDALQPDGGLAAQIVRQGAAVPFRPAGVLSTAGKPLPMRQARPASPYRLIYEAAKARIIAERGILPGKATTSEEPEAEEDETAA